MRMRIGKKLLNYSGNYMISKIPQSILGQIEEKSQFFQGKGWGAATVDVETKTVKYFANQLGLTSLVIIDAGANEGNWTESILTCLPQATVYAFEPNEQVFEILARRFKDNNNVTCINLGLSDDVGSVKLFSNAEDSGLSSLYSRRVDHFGIKLDLEHLVQVTTLDVWIANQPQNVLPTILKLDVEGHELSALVGSLKNLENLRIVQFEFGGGNIDSKTYFQDFWYFFAKLNFQIYRITPKGPLIVTEYSEQLEVFRPTNYLAVRS